MHTMKDRSEIESRVREFLQARFPSEAAKARILPGEKGVFAGALALVSDRALFVRERYGRLGLEGEYPVFHAWREKDAAVAAALFDALVAGGGEEAARCLFGIAADGAQSSCRIALEAIAKTAWISMVPILASVAAREEGERAMRIAATCSRVLRLPPSQSDEERGSDRAAARTFEQFWKDHAVRDPANLLRRAVEGNIAAAQAGGEAASEAERKLNELVPGSAGKEASGRKTPRDGSAEWLEKWGRIRDLDPERWANPAAVRGLEAFPDDRKKSGGKRRKGGK
jgi:hypothetical protein